MAVTPRDPQYLGSAEEVLHKVSKEMWGGTHEASPLVEEKKVLNWIMVLGD